jgi:hypothetical protein
MKKFLALSLLLGSIIFTVSSVEAKTTSENTKNAIEISTAQPGRITKIVVTIINAPCELLRETCGGADKFTEKHIV